jgi:hypothetical protein
MNERIRDLAVKADVWCDQNHAGDDHYDLMWEEKFAELIVQECAKFLEENSGYDDSNNAWHPEPEDLLEHFGVDK